MHKELNFGDSKVRFKLSKKEITGLAVVGIGALVINPGAFIYGVAVLAIAVGGLIIYKKHFTK